MVGAILMCTLSFALGETQPGSLTYDDPKGATMKRRIQGAAAILPVVALAWLAVSCGGSHAIQATAVPATKAASAAVSATPRAHPSVAPPTAPVQSPAGAIKISCRIAPGDGVNPTYAMTFRNPASGGTVMVTEVTVVFPGTKTTYADLLTADTFTIGGQSFSGSNFLVHPGQPMTVVSTDIDYFNSGKPLPQACKVVGYNQPAQ